MNSLFLPNELIFHAQNETCTSHTREVVRLKGWGPGQEHEAGSEERWWASEWNCLPGSLRSLFLAVGGTPAISVCKGVPWAVQGEENLLIQGTWPP